VNYHQYILNELRKDREMQLELDLGPKLPDIHCMHCNQVVPQPFYVVRHFGHMTRQLPFCNEQHANEYYLERLRESGF
jgi:hypothetical protein